MLRVAYLTAAVSPFWCDVARALESETIEFNLLFNGSPQKCGRPAHWENWASAHSDMEKYARVANDDFSAEQLKEWYLQQLDILQPDVVIAASYKPWSQEPALTYAKRNNKPLGLWAERPFPTRGLKKILKHAYISRKLRGFDFCFAIGDRALADYEQLMPSDNKTFLVPYGQDLEAFSPTNRVLSNDDELRVLFSGQFLARHNFHLIVESIHKLELRGVPYRLKYIFSGNGPEKWRIDKLLHDHPDLQGRIYIFDEPLISFEERAKHYLMADIFLYPSRYSGWGLVIPEAMAAGLTVLTTRNVEAARYFIDHGINGIFMRESIDGIIEALTLLIEQNDLRLKMSQTAIKDSEKGSARTVASRMASTMRYLGYFS